MRKLRAFVSHKSSGPRDAARCVGHFLDFDWTPQHYADLVRQGIAAQILREDLTVVVPPSHVQDLDWNTLRVFERRED